VLGGLEVAVVEIAADDPLTKALKEASVENWLRRLRPVTRDTYKSILKHRDCTSFRAERPVCLTRRRLVAGD